MNYLAVKYDMCSANDQPDFLRGKRKIFLDQKLKMETDSKWIFCYFLMTKKTIVNFQFDLVWSFL